MTTYTSNFNLEKYTTGDAANLTDQYNASMDIIDTNLYKVNTNATTALNTANNAKTQIQTTNNNLAALGVTDVSTATTTKTRWDTASTQAENNKNNISQLTTTTNTITTTITRSIGYNDNVVVIGDSWADGYYQRTKHPDASPANSIYTILRPTTTLTLGTSGGGFYVRGDDGTFLDRWNTVTNKQNVTRVIIIGGQNDAQKMVTDNVSLTNIDNAINNLLHTISTQAPNAIIDIFPMCLAIGESMNRQNSKWSVAPDYRQQVYNLFSTKKNIPNVVIHEGAYRAGVWASRAADGGDDGDGAHLTKGGYAEVGYAMGNCILHNTTFFPTQSGYPNNSQINGIWNNVSIFETNGILSIQYNVKCTSSQKNGDRIFTIAKQFSVGASIFYKDYSDKYFVSIDNHTLALQGVNNIQANDIIAGGIRLLAGF